jgi:carbamoyltransferase
MKHTLGVSAGFHDAALTLLDQHGKIVFAGHSERYSKQKNDADISMAMLDEIDMSQVDTVAYYERPWLKQLRQLYSGQGVEWNKVTTRQILKQQLGADRISGKRIKNYNHHLCHAAAGFQTSPYPIATVVVIDAVGEWDTVSIWGAMYDKNYRATYKKLWSQSYPHSIGLFYSAITKRIGLHPLDEEYITMGMAGWGRPQWTEVMRDTLVDNPEQVRFKSNLHTGLEPEFLGFATNADIAASAQQLTEYLIHQVMTRAKNFGWSNNLVYMGGVALNCLANRRLGEYFDNIWIMPCPGDAGSSLGAAALAYGGCVQWTSANLGHDIPGDYPVERAMAALLSDRIVGVASGRAEFGPRALGNRSLLADPRGTDIKDQVNAIKRRQKFRPFAPVILQELADRYFVMPPHWSDSRYMQVVAHCRFPEQYPAIIHVDGTSRVQTVPRDGSGIRKLLETWYAETGCPMLLNTSLNIRGEPMVNDRADANRFEREYGVQVCS